MFLSFAFQGEALPHQAELLNGWVLLVREALLRLNPRAHRIPFLQRWRACLPTQVPSRQVGLLKQFMLCWLFLDD